MINAPPGKRLDIPPLRPLHFAMRTVFLLMLALSGLSPVMGQMPPATQPDVTAPPVPVIHAPDTPLNVSPAERRYFELGAVLSKAAFSYAGLAQQTRSISKDGMSDAQLAQIGKLAPDAQKSHDSAHTLLDRAVTLLQGLKAPAKVVTPLSMLAGQFAKPLTPSGTSKQIAAFAPEAGTVLAALDESTHLSNLLDSKNLRTWATGPHSNPTGKVWYSEGLMAGVAGVAAALNQPDLLPPASELATDLRGLRDWLSLRLPETPTPDQEALQTALDTFLQQTSAKGTQVKTLTPAQLQDLGGISRLLEAQILPPDSPLSAPLLSPLPDVTAPNADTPAHPSPTAGV
jgi:hypothetical protein